MRMKLPGWNRSMAVNSSRRSRSIRRNEEDSTGRATSPDTSIFCRYGTARSISSTTSQLQELIGRLPS